MMKSILTLLFISGVMHADFIKHGDEVLDTSTNLIWQDNVASVQKTWSEAIVYCEGLSLGGSDAWRLPNVNELKSLAVKSKRNPAMDDAFEHTVSSYYWSSTSLKAFGDTAWGVRFGYGDDDNRNKDYNGYVRCVRDGQ